MSKSTIATAASSLGQAGGALLGSLLNSRPTESVIKINGQEVAKQRTSGRNTTLSYNQTDTEKELSDYVQTNLLNGLENINVFSDEVQQSINDQVKAYQRQGIRTINETYTPMFRELRTDIASRFGNLDNSVFLDNLNEIEKNRTNAIENLTQNILAKQSELYETEMNNRYNYLTQLSSINNDNYSNMLNMLRLAMGSNS